MTYLLIKSHQQAIIKVEQIQKIYHVNRPHVNFGRKWVKYVELIGRS